MPSNDYVIQLKSLHDEDIKLVGRDNIYKGFLQRADITIPKGFIVTTEAFSSLLDHNGLRRKIEHILATVDYRVPESVLYASRSIEGIIMKEPFSPPLRKHILSAFETYNHILHHAQLQVTPTYANDFLPPSLRNEYRFTPLLIKGETNFFLAIKEVFSSLFTPKHLTFLHEHSLSPFTIHIAARVEEFIPAEISGTMMFHDTKQKEIKITAVYGELKTSAGAHADEYIITSHEEVLKKEVQSQKSQLVFDGDNFKEIAVSEKIAHKPKVTDEDLPQLAAIFNRIHEVFFFPPIVNWKLYKHTLYVTDVHPSEQTSEKKRSNVVVAGISKTFGIKTGRILLIHSPMDLHKIARDNIVVIDTIKEIELPYLRKAAAIIASENVTSFHLISEFKKIGIPFFTNIPQARKLFQPNEIITVNSKSGEITRGSLSTSHHPTQLSKHKDLLFYVYIPMSHIPSSLPSHVAGVILEGEHMRNKHEFSTYVHSLSAAIKEKDMFFIPNPHERIFREELQTLRHIKESGIASLSLLMKNINNVQDLHHYKNVMKEEGLFRNTTCKVWFSLTSLAQAKNLHEILEEGVDGIYITLDHLFEEVVGKKVDSTTEAKSFELLTGLLQNISAVTSHAHVPIAISMTHLSLHPHILTSCVSYGIRRIITTLEEVPLLHETAQTELQ